MLFESTPYTKFEKMTDMLAFLYVKYLFVIYVPYLITFYCFIVLFIIIIFCYVWIVRKL